MVAEKFKIGNIQNSHSSHELLCDLACFLGECKHGEAIIDFDGATFFAANLFSVLGCILTESSESNVLNIHCINMADCIISSMRKTGFGQCFKNMGSVTDVNHNAIDYKAFDVNAIEEYEKHITIELLSRKDLPKMSGGVKDSINDYLLEIFKNVADHTNSRKVYTCGQYFPHSKMLYFTVSNYGNTIRENVENYFLQKMIVAPNNGLKWAVQKGNTTSITLTPRGLGLHLIKEFIRINKGEFFIVSGNEAYELSGVKSERYMNFDRKFPGTFVSVGFNLNDTGSYWLRSELVNNTPIEF